MALNFKKVLKFLFPEYQIIESIRTYGFFVRKEKLQEFQVQTTRQRDRRSTQATSSGGMSPVVSQGENKTSAHQTDNQSERSYSGGKEKEKLKTKSIIKKFDIISYELEKEIIGQKDFLDRLCTAFKRPFITGMDRYKPRNIVFVFGNKGTGRHRCIGLLVSAMKKHRLLDSDHVSSINLSLYSSVADEDLFMSDLYNALSSGSEIIVFDNFEKCHARFIDLISSLAVDGRYTLDGRYAVKNNNLIETTGKLVHNTVSDISANRKYFVFTSVESQDVLVDFFGSKFLTSVGDIVQIDAYSDEELLEICEEYLVDFTTKCKSHLSYSVQFDDELVKECASHYQKDCGFNGVLDFMEKEIYLPLSEYRLSNNSSSTFDVNLSIGDGVVAVIDGNKIQLSEYTRKSPPTDIELVQKELDSIVGLEKVKEYVLRLEDNLKIQKIREEAGHKAVDISMHMIFTGNPGTGKTTIARIMAKYLKALGVLSGGQLREVSRADLVGKYVGHTAQQTRDVIQSALGGVLFIDEAYSLCRNKNDSFGQEAIDALVKGIEDNRDDLVVILAGYREEMEDFLEINPGLKSRFPNHIEFDDYSAEEMLQIAHLTASLKGYQMSEDCTGGLIRLFEKSQIKGKNDSGNGRLVRNIIESAILKQARRLVEEGTTELDVLAVEDFNFEDFEKFDLEASFEKVIGLESVKDFIRNQHKMLLANEKRRNAGIVVDTNQSLNMIFSGNPGTGKTTMARVVAAMFKGMGLLKSGHLVEVDRGDLVGEHVGETAQKTEKVFRSALGGVLFVDEAYALVRGKDRFGSEAIDTLVKLIEDYRGEIVVILAGYKKEMAEFMKANSGLSSRFALHIDFPDYTQDELYHIALKIIDDKGFNVEEQAKSVLYNRIGNLHKRSNAESGNGRMVRNLIEMILRDQSARIASGDETEAEDLIRIISQDIETSGLQKTDFDLEAELSEIIGLEEVKSYLRSLKARLRIQKERKRMGLSVDSAQTLHMVFKGNPGTGKTMVARTVARLLYNMGVIDSDKIVETDRAGLVAGYVGQTAIKTTEKVMEAMDGVLFIDEAYSLSQGVRNDFGREAIDTLVKLIDDHRERLVVILAGYSAEMEQFLSVNPGLKSRFANVIEFADYSAEQLLAIADLLYRSKGYQLTEDTRTKLLGILQIARQETAFGNGRYVRNLFERSINNQALRLSSDTDLTREEITTIEDADIERV